jgi:APA family basic amino acid/polyamine antiporter
MVLRVTRPEVERPFRVSLVWLVAPLGAAACIYTMLGLPTAAWERFGIWLAVGLGIYFVQKMTARKTAG